MSSIAVAMSTMSWVRLPPKAKYAKSVTIGRTRLPPLSIRWLAMSSQITLARPNRAHKVFFDELQLTRLTQLNGSSAP